MAQKQLEIIEKQKQELEYQKWQFQFEKDFALKQLQQMMEEAEMERKRKKEEERKRRREEEMAHEQLANFAEELEEVYKIKDDAPDLQVEDIIEDIAVDIIDLHDSDESGADL